MRALARQLTRTSKEVYYNTLGKRKLAEEHIDDLIQKNYSAARKVFIGFVGGLPSGGDDGLMTCYKVVGRDVLQDRDYLLAHSFVSSLGFQLIRVNTEQKDVMKVMLSPGAGISKYLTDMSIRGEHEGVADLYARIK